MVMLSIVFILYIRKDASVRKVQNQSLPIRPKVVKSYPCPPPDHDTDLCENAYKAAVTSIDTTDTSWTAIKVAANAKIDDYVDKCLTSRCQEKCLDLLKDNDLSVAITATDLEDCEQPDPVVTAELGTTICTSEAADNEETCKGAYEALISATTPTAAKPWTGATIVSSVSAYVTACKKTACSNDCRSIISGANVALQYTSLLLNLNAKCNPYPPAPPVSPGDSGIMTIERSLSIFFFFLGLIGLELVTFF
jgi:hypothetical protein